MIKKLKTAWRRFRKYWGRDLSWLEFKGPAAVAHVNMKEYLKKLEVKKQIKALAKINARSQIHIEGAGVMSRPTLDIIKSEEAKKQIAALPEFIEHMQIRTKLDIAPPLLREAQKDIMDMYLAIQQRDELIDALKTTLSKLHDIANSDKTYSDRFIEIAKILNAEGNNYE